MSYKVSVLYLQYNRSSESYIYPRQGSHVLQSVCCIFTVQQIIGVLHLPEARITRPTKCLLYIYSTTDHQSLTSTRGKDHTSYKVSVVYLLYNRSSESYIYPRQGSHVLQSVCCIFTVQQIIRVLHLPEARITRPTKCLLYIYCTTVIILLSIETI